MKRKITVFLISILLLSLVSLGFAGGSKEKAEGAKATFGFQADAATPALLKSTATVRSPNRRGVARPRKEAATPA